MSWMLFGMLNLAQAQDITFPMPSPGAEVMQRVGIVDVTVSYSSPGKKGREVWGGVVPYDQLWRTGANAPTTLETSADLVVAGKAVPAGTYSVFTIPGKNQWTFILNGNVEASTDDYEQGKDVVRVQIDAAKGPERERMTFLFSDTTDAGTRLDLEWDGVRLSVPITVETTAMVNQNIGDYVEATSDKLARAGRYRLENGNLDGAIALLDDSIAVRETWYNTFIKADALHQQEKHKAAYALALRAQELGKDDPDFFYKERVEKALREWKKK
jgi:Protein of unknown function (DUF2911)